MIQLKLANVLKLLAITFVLSGCNTASSPQPATTETWATSWATATENIREGFWMSKGHFPPKPLKNDTFRMFVRTSVGGDTLRVKFSNEFGLTPVTLQTVRIAEAATPDASATQGAILLETDTPLSFSGQPEVVISPGDYVYSDPVGFELAPLEVVSISIHYGDIDDKPITGHRGARTTSFFTSGNQVSREAFENAVTKDVWYTATALEVATSSPPRTIVAMGDSITDGYGTRYNHHTRWTDYLAQRLQQHPQTETIGMANVGIGGSGSDMSIERFQRDVLDIKGANWVILFIGINDIVYGKDVSASKLIDNYKTMAAMAHANGLHVYGATITPMGTHSETHNTKETIRQQVNEWIRTTAREQGFFDGTIDFDAAARDPNRPTYLLPAYAVDDLHLNITGYLALAEAVDLSLFQPE